MEFPQTVHPSRLSPHFIKHYIWPPLLSAAVAVAVFYLRPFLDFLPFNPLYLGALALIPLLYIVKVEVIRRHREYVFHRDRVEVRHGIETIEQDSLSFQKVTDVHSLSPLFERLVDVGDLEIHIAGTQETVKVEGVRHPEKYEKLMLGGSESGEGGEAESVREEMRQLERRYENGELSRREYENRYYYLEGKLEALEGD